MRIKSRKLKTVKNTQKRGSFAEYVMPEEIKEAYITTTRKNNLIDQQQYPESHIPYSSSRKDNTEKNNDHSIAW